MDGKILKIENVRVLTLSHRVENTQNIYLFVVVVATGLLNMLFSIGGLSNRPNVLGLAL